MCLDYRRNNLQGTKFNHFKGALSGLRQFLATESPLKMMKSAFFHLKSSFRTQDIYVFVLTFWSCIKTARLKR